MPEVPEPHSGTCQTSSAEPVVIVIEENEPQALSGETYPTIPGPLLDEELASKEKSSESIEKRSEVGEKWF